MIHSVITHLNTLNGVHLCSGIGSESLDKLQSTSGIIIPLDHRSALEKSNGVEAYGGYVRLFGVGSQGIVDAIMWNDPSYWKFAWDGRSHDYWCFAETAWGDQYAYNIPALKNGDTGVYLLDCLSMTPTRVASTFSDFFHREFLRSAKDPYDIMLKEARRKLGDLAVGDLLVYVPSLLLGGAEVISNVQKMAARAAMICNGDIACQLDSAPVDGKVKGVTAYEDVNGRTRIKLEWA